MARVRNTRLYAEHEGQISGDQDQITFYHGLMVKGTPVQPDGWDIHMRGLPATGAGNVGGELTAIVTARSATSITFRIRGMRTTDFVTYRVQAWRFHTINRVGEAAKASGTDLAGTGGSAVVTSATATFLTSDPPVRAGDAFYLCQEDTAAAPDVTRNGAFTVLSVDSDNQITLTAAIPGAVAPFAGLRYVVDGPASVIGESAATFDQIPFPMPADAAYAGGAITNMNVSLPGAAIEVDEMANLASGSVLMGNATNRPAPVAIAGDVNVDNAGLSVIQPGAVEDGMIDAVSTLAFGVAAGYRVARGTATVPQPGGTLNVVTGLTTVVAAVAVLQTAPAATACFVAVTHAGAAGTIDINTYTSAYAAASTDAVVDWVAIGT